MRVDDWKDALRKEVPQCESNIRFGLPCVPIAHLAKQYFCEQQLDYEYKYGKEISETEAQGTLIHEEAFAGEEVDVEQGIESIDKESFYRCKIPVYFEL